MALEENIIVSRQQDTRERPTEHPANGSLIIPRVGIVQSQCGTFSSTTGCLLFNKGRVLRNKHRVLENKMGLSEDEVGYD